MDKLESNNCRAQLGKFAEMMNMITRSHSLCWSTVGAGAQEEHKYTYLRTWIQLYWSTCRARLCRSHYCFFSVRQPWKGIKRDITLLGHTKTRQAEDRIAIMYYFTCTWRASRWMNGRGVLIRRRTPAHVLPSTLAIFVMWPAQTQNGSLPVRNRYKRCICARVRLIQQHHDTQL